MTWVSRDCLRQQERWRRADDSDDFTAFHCTHADGNSNPAQLPWLCPQSSKSACKTVSLVFTQRNACNVRSERKKVRNKVTQNAKIESGRCIRSVNSAFDALRPLRQLRTLRHVLCVSCVANAASVALDGTWKHDWDILAASYVSLGSLAVKGA